MSIGLRMMKCENKLYRYDILPLVSRSRSSTDIFCDKAQLLQIGWLILLLQKKPASS